jgi:hypothetical protein
MAISAEVGDALSGLYPQRTKRSGKLCRTLLELSVGNVFVTTYNGDFAGKLLACVTQKASWRKRNIHDCTLDNFLIVQADWPPSTTSTWPVT